MGLRLTGSGSSHFAITIHPGIDGFVQIEYLGGSFILPGDYNGDHVVDAADYTVWRNRLGDATTLPNEDPNTTPGLVTQEDYEIWRSYYGETSSSTNGVGAVRVPEPAAASYTARRAGNYACRSTIACLKTHQAVSPADK